LKAGGCLNEKFPGGMETHKELLEKEGLQVVRRGKNYFVENFQNYLIKEL
jgi:hypothetical protein